MHGFDAKLDCLVFGERAALLDAAEGFAAEGHPRHRLKQLAVAHLWATLVQALKQLAVELDSLGWRCGHARNRSATALLLQRRLSSVCELGIECFSLLLKKCRLSEVVIE